MIDLHMHSRYSDDGEYTSVTFGRTMCGKRSPHYVRHGS